MTMMTNYVGKNHSDVRGRKKLHHFKEIWEQGYVGSFAMLYLITFNKNYFIRKNKSVFYNGEEEILRYKKITLNVRNIIKIKRILLHNKISTCNRVNLPTLFRRNDFQNAKLSRKPVTMKSE